MEKDMQVRHGMVNKKGSSIDPDKRYLPDEPSEVVKFVNSADPKTPVSFTLGLQIPDETRKSGKRTVYERYHLLDQYVYRLPVRVIKHLMSLRYPIYEDRKDEGTGQITSVQIGWSNRFSLVPEAFLPEGNPQVPSGHEPESKRKGEAKTAAPKGVKDPLLKKALEGAEGGTGT